MARRTRVCQLAVQSAEAQVGEDVAPERDSRIFKSLRECQKPLIVNSLGETKDPSEALLPLHSSGVSSVLHEMEQHYRGLLERLDGRVRLA